MKTATGQETRPEYYEGQYLGAADLEAAVHYARAGQARHTLGAHLWGIALGLDLTERALPGDEVEMVLTPGVAWDGYGRAVIAPAPERLSLALFAGLADTLVDGTPVEIWLTYRELPTRPPPAGFNCPDNDLHAGVVETYRIEIRATPITDYHSVTIAGRTVEAGGALKAFDASKGTLYDESLPQQTFPEDGGKARWPVFVGIVRWRKDTGQPGRLIKRRIEDLNSARSGRRYLGAVAESIVAADGVLRLRDRSKNPNDPTLNYRPPIVAPAGVVNDLVWCEGHLRVVGDTRLQGGALDYRVATGGDDGVPMYLRRTFVPGAIPKTTLDAFIGRPAPAPGPANAETRFTVSSTDKGLAKECLTVVTDGRVGINAADPGDPTNTLHVRGPTGIRYASGYVTGDEGGGWTALAFNAYAKTGSGWVLRDVFHTNAAAVVLDEVGGVPRVKIQTSSNKNPLAWDEHVVVKGDTGNVGIGTAAPDQRLHVVGKRIRLGDNKKRIDLRTDGSAVDLHSETDSLYIRSSAPGKNVTINALLGDGNVGIGTETPSFKLDVNGSTQLSGPLVLNGDTFSVGFGGIWTTSDVEEKQHIEAIRNPLERLLALHGTAFEWREPAKYGGNRGPHLGFIAQDVEKVFPEWVKDSPLGTKAVNLGGLDALTVEAIRELATRCAHLEAELAELRARLDRGPSPSPREGGSDVLTKRPKKTP